MWKSIMHFYGKKSNFIAKKSQPELYCFFKILEINVFLDAYTLKKWTFKMYFMFLMIVSYSKIPDE